jgi:hypothetical protein
MKLKRIVSILAWPAAFLLLMLAGIAFANAPPLEQLPIVPAVTPPSQGAIDWTQIVLRVVMAVVGLLGTVITTVLLPAGMRWLQAKAADQNASATTKLLVSATMKLDTFVEAGVAQAWRVFEKDMADAQRPDSDGGAFVTSAELQKAKDDVLASVKGYLGAAGLAQLTGVLGFGGEMLDSYLRAQIDKKVQAAQQAGSIAAASITTGQAAAEALSRL